MADPAAVPPPGPGVRVRAVPTFRPWDWPVFALLSLAGIGAVGWFAYGWLRAGPGSHPIAVLLLSAVVAMVLVNQQGRWFLLLPMRRPEPIAAAPGLRVAMVTTFVPGAESLEMIHETLAAMVSIPYPHESWLLDEGDDPDAAALCRRLGVHHFSRRGQERFQAPDGPFRTRSKHGNYNAWLHAVGFGRYDVLAAFDPDHVPDPGFLGAVLGYFRDPTIAYVQSAQAYYNQSASLVAGGAAEETYAYFSAIQMAGYGLGFPIIMGGHNVHRMAALEAVGGFAAHDADDLLLTLQYRAAGWQGVYLPCILARGLTPVDWRTYLVQQGRWARSVLDLKLRHRRAYAERLPLRTRLTSLLHGLNFLHRSLAYAVMISVLLFLLLTGSRLPQLGREMVVPALGLGVVLGTQELYRQRFYLDWATERGLHWRAALLGFAKWPWFLLALVDVLVGRRHPYQVTWKTARLGGYPPFVAWCAALGVSLLAAWWSHRTTTPLPLAVTALAVAATSLGLALHALCSAPTPFTPGLHREAEARRRRPHATLTRD